jgi:hypothetical protein
MPAIPVSVYTPTDNDEHLLECYDSLKDQTYPLWEWIVVPNNGVTIPEIIQNDSRVRITPHESGSIGELKRFAVSHSVGELLVELDHDDLLTSDALESIVDAHEETGAGFLYSDFITFRDEQSVVYDSVYGWENYPFSYDGHEYTAMRSFDPTPEALSHLQFSPNHVRAWSRAAYEKAGGYDGNYQVADDYDLITRTYITGEKFHRIPKCLYFYRNWSGSRSIGSKNQEIQENQRELSQARTYDMLDVWVKAQKALHINVWNPRHTNTNIDATRNVDMVDVYRLPDNSVGRIDAQFVLQYLPRQDIVPWMNAVYRKLIPGGWLIARVPSTDGRAAFENPTYQSYWNERTFLSFTNKEAADEVASEPGVRCQFHASRIWTDYHTPADKDKACPYAGAHLVAHKGQRLAGRMDI